MIRHIAMHAAVWWIALLTADFSPAQTSGAKAEAGPSTEASTFEVPGHYEPVDGRTFRPGSKPDPAGLEWKPGFRAARREGWTWVPSGWTQRPDGWMYRPGSWKRDEPVNDPGAGLSPGNRLILRQFEREARRYYAMQGQAQHLQGTYPTRNGPDPVVVVPPLGVLGRSPAPGSTYYIGNSAPGSSYPSYSAVGTGGGTTYAGRSGLGQAYPSYSSEPAGGTTFYAGQSGLGSSYPSYTTVGTSVGGYGYGTTAPGNTAGQVGGGP
jgi:hypothetical protein